MLCPKPDGEPMFDVLLKDIQLRKPYVSVGEIRLAMYRAVDMGLGDFSWISKYGETPPEERCKLVLDAYIDILKHNKVPDAEKRARMQFSDIVSEKEDPEYVEAWTKALSQSISV
jgi:hypothetical protein